MGQRLPTARHITLTVLVLALFSFSAHADRGKALFQLCTNCHGNNGQGMRNLEAPAISGLPAWYTATQLKKFKDGRRGKHHLDNPGLRMGPMARTLQTDKDIDLVSKYIESLPRTKTPHTISGDNKRGAQKYGVCIACHGPTGDGNKMLNAPPLKGINDWYMFTQIKNFQNGVRGNPAVDATGAPMAPMARLIGDDQAVRDLISYINSL